MSQSVWAKNIVYKGPADKKRSALFTRMARLITVAAREGGGDPNFNFKLRGAIDRALDNNMPKDSIERAVKKGTGELAADAIEEVLYEGYGPGGVAIIVEALTDNRHRTAANVKFAFTGNGGNLGTSGAVQWMFEKRGMVTLKEPTISEDAQLALIDAGVADITVQDGATVLVCAPDAIGKVRDAATMLALTPTAAAFDWSAKEPAAPLDAEKRAQLNELFEALEADEDVSDVYSNVR